MNEKLKNETNNATTKIYSIATKKEVSYMMKATNTLYICEVMYEYCTCILKFKYDQTYKSRLSFLILFERDVASHWYERNA